LNDAQSFRKYTRILLLSLISDNTTTTSNYHRGYGEYTEKSTKGIGANIADFNNTSSCINGIISNDSSVVEREALDPQRAQA